MKIIESNLTFKTLSELGTVKRIILHHAESKSCTINDIHQWHLANGWAGCGYHFLVRKDGTIYRGRPENKIGSHTANHNTGSLGICFEGTYNVDTMPSEQIKAGQELIVYLIDKYKLLKANVYKHKDFNSTDCPGSNFPFDQLVSGKISSIATTDTWYDQVVSESKLQGFNSPPTVKKGAKGNITKLIQIRLMQKDIKLPTYGADSSFGSETENAVKEFQKLNGLSPDGIVGEKTWNALK